MKELLSEIKDKLDSYIEMIKRELYKYDFDISKRYINWQKFIEALDKERKKEGTE